MWPPISLELIECDNMVNENFIHSYHCIESYKPGIFQKTILTMQSNIDKYDYFVRTNLSTFVIQDRLKSYLTHLNQSNVYDGVYCSKNANWIAGWGVVLDKNTCNMLIQDGIKEENFNKRVSDDVLIGKKKINTKRKIITNFKNITLQVSCYLSTFLIQYHSQKI